MMTTKWNGPVFCAVLLSLSIFQLACVEEGVEDDVDTATEALTAAETETYATDYSEPVDPVFLLDIPNQAAAEALFEDGIAHVESSDAFRQVSWMMDAEDLSGLQFRALNDGEWTEWENAEITFQEGIFHNALIRLDAPTTELQMRGGESIQSAELEFYEEVIARDEFVVGPEEVSSDQTTGSSAGGDIRTTTQGLAPMAISRSQWGAANPGKVCGNVVAPYRMAIHHTYRPSGDQGDPAARMRQMQSYHINNRGWCDIGYHFVVSQSGQIYQGRSRSNRPGAHVLGQNSGNVGIAFIADFSTQTITNTQKNAAANIMRWVHDTHGVALNRNSVRGHREHSGQSTSCPGNLVNGGIDELIALAGGSQPAPTNDPQPAPADDPQPAPSTGSTGGSSGGSSPSGGNNYTVEHGCSTMGQSPSEAPLSMLLLAALGLVVLRRK